MQLAAILLGLVMAVAQTPPPDALTRARQAYNERRFEDAISAAAEAGKVAGRSDAARLVTARALLERYRDAAAPNEADLVEARRLLKDIDRSKLAARDFIEHQVGLGEALYLENSYAAAAEFFATALARVALTEPETRDLVFEWWATALDHQAQFGPQADRRLLYTRILERSEEELARRDTSAVASYWLAAAAQGMDDLERAWGAAQAGWIRAGQLGQRGAQLRTDLDRLVRQVILPERARRLRLEGDPRTALALYLTEWEDLKKKWGTNPEVI
ncbi:MAG TPA: hypothetical protein VES67_05980 [Vicinamibacterales bacterium]|nr:hypothetical protein [Vicinamibacterales bacterium]